MTRRGAEVPPDVLGEARRRGFGEGPVARWDRPLPLLVKAYAALAVWVAWMVAGLTIAGEDGTGMLLMGGLAAVAVVGFFVMGQRSAARKRLRGAAWLFDRGLVVRSGGRLHAFDLATDIVRRPRGEAGTFNDQVEIARSGTDFVAITAERGDAGELADAVELASTRLKLPIVSAALDDGGSFNARGLVVDGSGVSHGDTHLAYAEITDVTRTEHGLLAIESARGDLLADLDELVEADLVITLIRRRSAP